MVRPKLGVLGRAAAAHDANAPSGPVGGPGGGDASGPQHDPKTGQFSANGGSAPSNPVEHKKQAAHHEAMQKYHESRMGSGNSVGQTDYTHAAAAGHHQGAARLHHGAAASHGTTAHYGSGSRYEAEQKKANEASGGAWIASREAGAGRP